MYLNIQIINFLMAKKFYGLTVLMYIISNDEVGSYILGYLRSAK